MNTLVDGQKQFDEKNWNKIIKKFSHLSRTQLLLNYVKHGKIEQEIITKLSIQV